MEIDKNSARGSLRDNVLRSSVAGEMRVRAWLQEKSAGDPEEGSTTVEYAIGTIATAAFAGLLLAVLKSGGVKALLTNVVSAALAI